MAIIATTIKSSINVKPCFLLFVTLRIFAIWIYIMALLLRQKRGAAGTTPQRLNTDYIDTQLFTPAAKSPAVLVVEDVGASASTLVYKPAVA